jgi:magnesium transporter
MKKPKKPLKPGTRAAGLYATKKVPIVPSHYTIADTVKLLRKKIKEFEVLDYVYVVDNRRLVGVFSIKRLYSYNVNITIKKICTVPQLISVQPHERSVRAAYLSLKHNISTVPVVNKNGLFLGVITKKTILTILHQKHVEDKFMQAGIHRKHAAFDDIMGMSIFQSIKLRLLWLFVGLFGGFVAAHVISSFEYTLSQNILLAAFIPLIVYTANAVGIQLEAFAVRDFALHSRLNFSKYVMKQLLSVVIIAVILGVTAAAMCVALYGSLSTAFVIGASIMGATLASIFTGLLIPFIFKKMKKDPASGSGPIGTIIQDILSVLILFTIASLLL